MKAVLFLVVVCLGLILATNPGFKARITQNGLSYANKVAMLALSTSIRNLKIPDQSGKSGKISFSLTNMKITGFTTPSSYMKLSASGIRWSASGAGLSMHGSFGYKYKQGWIKISDHGSFDASLNGVSFSLTVGLTDSSGKPRLSGSNCVCGVGSVKVHFHGGASWIYNLFSKYISGKVKDLLRGKMCDLVVQAINKDANNQLAKLPMTVVLAKKFELDYSLNGNPTFSSTYMETMHKGEVYWNGDKKECPFTPSQLPTSNGTARMLYLWVSDYMGNSLGYAGYQHGFLQYNLTAKDLPAANRSLLNTTCTNIKCIGTLIPQIGKKYPNSKVMFRMYATSAPVINITNVIGINFAGNIDLYVQTPQGKTPFLMTITCVFVTSVTATIDDQLLKGKIKSSSITVHVKNSTVGTVPDFVLQLMMNAAIDGFVVPTLNAQGEKGLVLPVTANIKFSNAQLSILKGAILIATDLSYLANPEETKIDGDAKMKVDTETKVENTVVKIVKDLETKVDEDTVLKHNFPHRHRNPDMSFKVVGQKNDIFDQI